VGARCRPVAENPRHAFKGEAHLQSGRIRRIPVSPTGAAAPRANPRDRRHWSSRHHIIGRPADDSPGFSQLTHLGKENFSSGPISKIGFFRFVISSRSSDSAVIRMGMAIVESQLQVTMLAS
jgi:hypothetical protein